MSRIDSASPMALSAYNYRIRHSQAADISGNESASPPDCGLKFVAVVGTQAGYNLLGSYGDSKSGCTAQGALQNIWDNATREIESVVRPGSHVWMKWEGGMACLRIDEDNAIVSCVVTASESYPEKLAWRLLVGLEDAVNQQLPLQDKIQELVALYEDPVCVPQSQVEDHVHRFKPQRKRRKIHRCICVCLTGLMICSLVYHTWSVGLRRFFGEFEVALVIGLVAIFVVIGIVALANKFPSVAAALRGLGSVALRFRRT